MTDTQVPARPESRPLLITGVAFAVIAVVLLPAAGGVLPGLVALILLGLSHARTSIATVARVLAVIAVVLSALLGAVRVFGA